jgi:hypothetical protein
MTNATPPYAITNSGDAQIFYRVREN